MATIEAGEALWTAVDDYLAGHLVERDPVLDAALADSEAAGLPPIQVTALQGRMLQLLARMTGAHRILELGTLGGYSTIWLARALAPGGKLVSLEFSPKHAAVARKNLERAGVAAVVDVREGPALTTLPQLEAEGAGPFDFIFIDADKQNYPHYLDWAIRLARPGAAIVTDNVVREGTVLDADDPDPVVQGTRSFLEALGAEKRVTATAIQTVNGKAYDGFALMLVNG